MEHKERNRVIFFRVCICVCDLKEEKEENAFNLLVPSSGNRDKEKSGGGTDTRER